MKRFVGLFFRAISALIFYSPHGVQVAVGNFIGFLWFDVFRVRRSVAIENVARAFPQLPLSEQVRIARESLKHMGRTVAEFTSFPFAEREYFEKTFVITGAEHFRSAFAKNKGVLMLTLHLGNGDLATACLSRLNFPINLISKQFKTRWLNDLWFGMRAKHGTRFIAHEKSSFDILRTLKKNGAVVFVLDQFMGPPVGVRTTFFGVETGTAAGLALMAARTGAPVVPCYTFRRDDGLSEIVFEPELPSDSFDSDTDASLRDQKVRLLTQIYTDKIESIVRQYPEQWMWIHRRWKTFND
jgi:Kdo2-lipid IVA lauroyltransferase/acyltransferase